MAILLALDSSVDATYSLDLAHSGVRESKQYDPGCSMNLSMLSQRHLKHKR